MKLTREHADYIASRGIDPQLAVSLGVRSEGPTAIAFDYRNAGKIHNAKVRKVADKKMWFAEKDRTLIPWNVDCLRPPVVGDDEALIWTEGEFDALALIQAGFKRVVSVPNGGAGGYPYLYPEGKVEDDELKSRLHPAIDRFPVHIIATDADDVGVKLRDGLSVRLGDVRCKWVKWPDGCKDANDVLVKHGPQAIVEAIKNARHMYVDDVSRMSEIADSPPEAVLTLGHPLMDEDLSAGGIRIPATGFMVVSGPAHSGKSIFVRQLVWHLWRTYGVSFFITALEEKAKPRYLRDFRRFSIGRPIEEWTTDDVALADEEIDKAMVIYRRHPDRDVTFELLTDRIDFAIRHYGLGAIVIDPFNEIERGDNRNAAEETGKMIMGLKNIADKYKVLMIVIAHPALDQVRSKKEGVPYSLADIEGSRHWMGKPDVGFMIWPSTDGNGTILRACKLKDNETMGRPKYFKLDHVPAINGYACVSRALKLSDLIAGPEKPRTSDGWSPTDRGRGFSRA